MHFIQVYRTININRNYSRKCVGGGSKKDCFELIPLEPLETAAEVDQICNCIYRPLVQLCPLSQYINVLGRKTLISLIWVN